MKCQNCNLPGRALKDVSVHLIGHAVFSKIGAPVPTMGLPRDGKEEKKKNDDNNQVCEINNSYKNTNK